MEILKLDKRSELDLNEKLKRKFLLFEKLINELAKKQLPDALLIFLNEHIKKVNETKITGGALKIQLKRSQYQILKKVERELKLVVKNHYRNMWLGVGMALGVAFGSVLGTGSGNMSLLAIGLPIGMAVGIAYGTNLDKKAKKEGKQLDLELH